MIDLKQLKEQRALVEETAKRRRISVNIDRILQLDEEVRALKQQSEACAAERNAMSATIAAAQGGEREGLIAQMKEVADKEKELKESLGPKEKELQVLMYAVPNFLHPDVPDGKDESENQTIREVGTLPTFAFEPKDHLELGKILDCVDTETASTVSGARFTYLKNGAAELQLAIMNLVIDTLTSESKLKEIADQAGLSVSTKPFQFVLPPVMIRPEVYRKMGRLSDDVQDERYYLQQDDLYLIGSAEHTLGPMLMDTIVSENELPIRYIGYSTSFRREAGSYGKDTKGIIRLHQFDKLEMESFTAKEQSEAEQNFIVAIQEYLIRQLELPYRVVMICTGDIGSMDARQIDIECWIPTQNTYRETHTSDLMTDYQARRLGAKYRLASSEKEFLHMNDATAFAMSRIIVAILENHQQEDGSVAIPAALQPYMRGQTRLMPR